MEHIIEKVDTFKMVSKVHVALIEKHFPTVNFELSGDANLYEAISAFESFLRAVGYHIPEGAKLELVEKFEEKTET